MSPPTSHNRRRPQSALVLPAVLFDHVRQFDDKLALLVLLAGLVGLLVLPAQRGLAAITVNVSHGVEACKSKKMVRPQNFKPQNPEMDELQFFFVLPAGKH